MRKIPLILGLLLFGALLSFALFAPVNADTPIKEAAPAPQTNSEEVEKAPPLPAQAGIEAVSTGYAWSQTTTTYTEITGGTVHGTASNDDTSFNAVPLGFTFTYNGVNYTQVSIQSNGFIAMGASVSNSYTPLSTGATNNVLSIVGRDLQGNATTSELMSKLEGDAPNRVFTIQWKQYKRWGTSYVGDDFNFQIKLHETSNLVQFVYGPFTAVTVTTPPTVQVGLRGAASSDFQNRTTGPTGWTDTLPGTLNSSSMSLTNAIFPPSGLTWNWSVIPAPNFNQSAKTAVPTFARAGEVIDYQIVIRNTGDDTATAANMNDPLPAGATYVPGSLATNGSPAATYDMGTNTIQWGATDLAPGAAVTVTFQMTATAVSGVNIVNTATISATNILAPLARTATTAIVGCADDQFYTCADSLTPGGPAFTWYSAISGTLILDAGATVGDDRAVNVTMPFPFTFYGTTSDSIRVGDNGAILFNATTGTIGFTNLVMASAPANFIAPFWDDMDTDTGGTYVDVFGVEPNRIFVVEWNDRPHFSNVGAATFQVLFFEGTNEIVFQYQDVDFGNALYDNGASATVGIKGNTIQYSFNQPALSDGLAIQFTPIPQPAITMTKTVGTDPGECALTDAITLPPSGGEVTYCFTVENTGEVTFAFHDLEDSEFGDILTGFSYSLVPGASVFLTQTATITATTVNTATWTAYNAGPSDLVTATDTATVTVPDSAFVRVAHLAPFAMDPGTAVTITLNGVPALTNFAYGDSTPYIQVAAGNVFVEVFPEGSATAAISDTLALTLGTYYTVVALGDGANHDLDLLALEDDNTAPAAGEFHLRLGHLAPFAAGLATADIRLQDGTPVITDVNFSDVTGYLPLPAGTYDLKITTPGGGTTLIDPAPVDFAEGAIVTAFATGEGSNQDLGVFAYPVDVEGFFLRLAVAEIALTKTVGTDSSVCATTDEITVSSGTTVYYCYEVTNTGDLTLNLHDLVDDQLGTIFSGFNYALAPNSSVNTVAAGLSIPAVITATTINTATWTAYNAGPADVATASDTATVTVVVPSNGLPLEDFNAGTAGFPPAGWSVINNGGTCVWESTETTGYANLTGGDGFAVEANSDDCGSGTTMNTELRTPFFNLTGATSPVLTYRYDYRDIGGPDQGTVDISTDGGATWTNLVTYLISDRGPAQNVVDLSAYIAEPLLQLRFTYIATGWHWWFQVDDVAVLLESAPEIAVDPDALASSQLVDTINTLSLNIANVGTASLNWEISEAPVSCATPDDIAWLSAAPITGTIGTGEDATVTVTFDSTGLAVGTYNGFLCVESDDPVTPLVAVPVELEVEPQANIEVSPLSLSSTQVQDTSVVQTLTISNTGDAPLDWTIEETLPDRQPPTTLQAAPEPVFNVPAVVTSRRQCALFENYIGAEPVGYAQFCGDGEVTAVQGNAPHGPASTGYTLNLRTPNRNLYEFILNDFPGQTVVGPQADNIYALDFDATAATLYGLNSTSGQLGMISTTTGAFTPIVACAPPDAGTWTGLSIDPVTNVFYASTAANLYTLDPATCSPVLIGPFGIPGGIIIDIAIGSAGVMYGHDIFTDAIYTIDTATGAATLVGPTGYNANFAQGMDFDNEDGTLYIWLYIGTGVNHYGTVDLATGAVTPLASTNPSGEFEGATQTVSGCVPNDYPWLSVNPASGMTAPGGSSMVDVTFDSTGLAPGTYTGQLCIRSNDPDQGPGNGTNLVVLPVELEVEPFVPEPAITIIKTVGTDPDVCAATSEIAVQSGTTVYYCYTVTNTGNVTLDLHNLEDDVLGEIFAGLEYALTPESSVNTVAAGLTISATITADTTNTATWTAYNAGPTDVVTATATATVTVIVYKLYLPIIMKP
jgi:uncharacterized repeat protein (TIGR01451 family)